MGYPGKSRKMYARPRTPWQTERIAGEVEVVKAYGLRNKRELWKAQAVLKKYRQASRKLLAAVSLGEEPPQAQAILNRLKKDKLVTTSLQESDRGPVRKYYSLTAAGRKRVEDMNQRWGQLRKAITRIVKEVS